MTKKHSENLRISFPRWFVILLSFCGTVTIMFSVSYIGWVIYSGQLTSRLFRTVIFFSLVLGIFWFLSKILFYSVTATEGGLETDNIVGSKQMFLWDEIVEVRRPRFRIPKDASYVISKNKDKLLLVRSMTNYKELVQMIKVRALNLKRCQS